MKICIPIGISILALLVAGCGAAPAAAPVPSTVAPPTAGKPSPTSTVAAVPTVTAPPATPTTAPPTATETPSQPGATARAPAPTAATAVNPGGPRATAPAATGASAVITTSSGRQVTVQLEVADTPEARSTGLSKRSSLPENSGMVFVFPSDVQAPFWMKDTWIPLSIAFISADGRIVDIEDMQPMTEDLHVPAKPYRYALEANLGFFGKNGIKTGDQVVLQLGGSR